MPRWREHEKKGRRSKHFQGYRISAQKSSRSTGLRPDYFGVSKRNPKKRIVADVKHVKELTVKHVKQVRRYKGYPFFAQKGVIIVRQATKVSERVRRLAKDSNINIVRMRARRKNRSFWNGLFG